MSVESKIFDTEGAVEWFDVHVLLVSLTRMESDGPGAVCSLYEVNDHNIMRKE